MAYKKTTLRLSFFSQLNSELLKCLAAMLIVLVSPFLRSGSGFAQIINTIAGTGIGSYNSDGIAATAANLNYPYATAFDVEGNIYIGDNTHEGGMCIQLPQDFKSCGAVRDYSVKPNVCNQAERLKKY